MHHYNYRSPSFCPFSDLNFRISYMVRCISDLVRYQLRLVVRIVIRWPITAVTRPSKPPAITYHKKRIIRHWYMDSFLRSMFLGNRKCNLQLTAIQRQGRVRPQSWEIILMDGCLFSKLEITGKRGISIIYNFTI
jgi:hypothetical protein